MKAKLGSGKRFAAVAESARESGAHDPDEVAAMAGMRKYGAKKMQEMAAKGRARSHPNSPAFQQMARHNQQRGG